jgi:D-alanyl-D-alanine carboxypeptidase
MKKTVAAPGFDSVGGSRYGLGLATFALSCGGFAWTHGGISPGYVTVVGIAASGKAATVAVNSMVPDAHHTICASPHTPPPHPRILGAIGGLP